MNRALILLAGFISGLGGGLLIPAINPDPPADGIGEVPPQMATPYPILFIHGLGQKEDAWTKDDGLRRLQDELQLGLAGSLIGNSDGSCTFEPAVGSATKDLYLVRISDPYSRLEQWARELDACVKSSLLASRATEVVLVGYSMGGLAARQYLVNHLNDHQTHRLITIGTPHMGSPYAKLGAMKRAFTEWAKQQRERSVWETGLATLLDDQLSELEHELGVDLDAPALIDLMPPRAQNGGEKSANFDLAFAPHPMDVEYVSIVGEIDPLGSTDSDFLSAAVDAGRRLLGAFDGDLFCEGDGIVCQYSQSFHSIPWFQMNYERPYSVVYLETSHSKHPGAAVEGLKKALP